MVKYISIVLVFISVVSCFPIIHDKNMLGYNNKTRTTMRTDGYYYRVEVDKEGIIYIFPIKFFEEGYVKEYVFINAIQESIHSINYNTKCSGVNHENNMESALKKTDCFLKNYDYFEELKNKYPKINRNTIDGWGKYNVINDSISVKSYYNYKGNYYLSEKRGLLLNEKEIIFKQYFLLHTNHSEPTNEKYYFRKLENINDYPDRIKQIR